MFRSKFAYILMNEVCLWKHNSELYDSRKQGTSSISIMQSLSWPSIIWVHGAVRLDRRLLKIIVNLVWFWNPSVGNGLQYRGHFWFYRITGVSGLVVLFLHISAISTAHLTQIWNVWINSQWCKIWIKLKIEHINQLTFFEKNTGMSYGDTNIYVRNNECCSKHFIKKCQ